MWFLSPADKLCYRLNGAGRNWACNTSLPAPQVTALHTRPKSFNESIAGRNPLRESGLPGVEGRESREEDQRIVGRSEPAREGNRGNTRARASCTPDLGPGRPAEVRTTLQRVSSLTLRPLIRETQAKCCLPPGTWGTEEARHVPCSAQRLAPASDASWTSTLRKSGNLHV